MIDNRAFQFFCSFDPNVKSIKNRRCPKSQQLQSGECSNVARYGMAGQFVSPAYTRLQILGSFSEKTKKIPIIKKFAPIMRGCTNFFYQNCNTRNWRYA
jgi:hypothetical protein